MTPDTSDIARRLRQTRANMLGTADEEHYWDCHAAADEIERQRLTDAEREAVEAAATFADEDGWLMKKHIATLRGLLERMT
jgi:hypothetical protein